MRPIHSVPRVLLIGTAVWLGFASTSFAQTPSSDDSKVKLGGGVMLPPDYQGSGHYELKMIPDIEINYRDSLFLRNNSLSYNAVRTIYPASNWRAGPRAG